MSEHHQAGRERESAKAIIARLAPGNSDAGISPSGQTNTALLVPTPDAKPDGLLRRIRGLSGASDLKAAVVLFTMVTSAVVATLAVAGVGRSDDSQGKRPEHNVSSVDGAPRVELRRTSQGFVGVTKDPGVTNVSLIVGRPIQTDRNALGSDISRDAKFTDTALELEKDGCVGVKAITKPERAADSVEYTGKACITDTKVANTDFYRKITVGDGIGH